MALQSVPGTFSATRQRAVSSSSPASTRGRNCACSGDEHEHDADGGAPPLVRCGQRDEEHPDEADRDPLQLARAGTAPEQDRREHGDEHGLGAGDHPGRGRRDPLLRDRRDRLFGILNGIDYEVMNPATDKYIAQNYDAEHPEKRSPNKLALQQEAGLTVDAAVPLVGIISRLTDQKGFDILADVIDHLLDLDLQFVVLGTGDPHYHEMFSRVAQAYAGKAAVFLTFNAELAQKIYAGADLFLMPSRFEPCGLGQMIAMRYGSVPVVRATGGLADTVRDFDPRSGEGNGFSFEPYDRWALFAAIMRAVENFKYKDTWRKLQVRGMSADFSWSASARKYIDLYHRALAACGQQIKLEDYAVVKKEGKPS